MHAMKESLILSTVYSAITSIRKKLKGLSTCRDLCNLKSKGIMMMNDLYGAHNIVKFR